MKLHTVTCRISN